MKKAILFALLFALLLISCKKQRLNDNCRNLYDGITANNVEEVRVAVTNAISQLGNKEHTANNLSGLAALLSAQCGMNAEVLCFNCIQTNPGQSEIKLSFVQAGTVRVKVIDITEAVSKMMIFVNMHE